MISDLEFIFILFEIKNNLAIWDVPIFRGNGVAVDCLNDRGNCKKKNKICPVSSYPHRAIVAFAVVFSISFCIFKIFNLSPSPREKILEVRVINSL